MADVPFGSAVYWKNTYWASTQEGNDFYSQVETNIIDSTKFMPSIIETNDIRLFSLQGFQKVYCALILGESFGGVHYVTIEAAYDSAISYTDSVIFTINQNANEPWNFKWNLPRRRMSAIRFRIYDSPDNVAPSSGFCINALSLLVEPEGETAELPTTYRKG